MSDQPPARRLSLGELWESAERWAMLPNVDFEACPNAMVSTAEGLDMVTLLYAGPKAIDQAKLALRWLIVERKANAVVWLSENWATTLTTQEAVMKYTR